MTEASKRPPFLISSADVPEVVGSYQNSDESLSAGRRIGEAAGLLRIGLHLDRVPPGRRTSWPHAEEKEEEFVFVLEGEIDAWIDGEVHRLRAGDLAAFPAGTGIAHTFINNGAADALLLVGGERDKPDNRIAYPLHPQRRADMPWSRTWSDRPARPLGPHDGLPDVVRARTRGGEG
jgi:uncharacterized cupin superfamily protein